MTTAPAAVYESRSVKLWCEVMQSTFTGDEIEDVRLTRSPLESVFAQITFPVQLDYENADVVAALQRNLQDDYPILRESQSVDVVVNSNEVSSTPRKFWRFHAADHQRHISLGTTFLALDVANYKSRIEFVSDFEKLLRQLVEVGAPARIDRLGVRYVNRLSGADITPEALARSIRSSALGALELADVDGSKWEFVAGQAVAVLTSDDANLQARWGRCPADQGFAPGIRSVIEDSWLIDIDCFVADSRPFSVEESIGEIERYCKAAYSFFRWVVTDEFIKERR